MTREQIDRLSSRLLDKATQLEESENATDVDADVAAVLMDCVEALEKISQRLGQH